MSRHLAHLHTRQHAAHNARLRNIQAGRHMIGQYDHIEMSERAALDAFRGGWALGDHWNHLAECRNVLMFGACHKLVVARAKTDAAAVREVTRLALEALVAIRDREQRTGKFGATADEVNVLSALVETSRDFWTRQPAELFLRCIEAVRAQVVKTVEARGGNAG